MLDPELRKQLTLTTADLRFAEGLVKSATENCGDDLFDETGKQCEQSRIPFNVGLESNDFK